VAGEVAHTLSSFAPVSTPARARNTLQITGRSDGQLDAYNDCVRLAREADLSTTMTALVAGLNRRAIEQCPHFAVHSSVVARNANVVAIPAESGGGKTTLAAALVKTGFSYLSDEALVLTDSGEVIPYPKPFALSPWSAEQLGVGHTGDETLVRSEDLGGLDGRPPGNLTDVILSEYGHDGAVLEPLPRSQAMISLLNLSFNHYKDPERAYRISSSVAQEVDVWQLRYSDPIEAAELIKETL